MRGCGFSARLSGPQHDDAVFCGGFRLSKDMRKLFVHWKYPSSFIIRVVYGEHSEKIPMIPSNGIMCPWIARIPSVAGSPRTAGV